MAKLEDFIIDIDSEIAKVETPDVTTPVTPLSEPDNLGAVQPSPLGETRFFDAAKAGLESTITSKVFQAGEKLVSGTDFLKAAKFTPRNAAESAIATAFSFVDPAAILPIAVAGRFAPISPQIFNGLKKVVGAKNARPVATAALKAQKAELLGVSEGSAKLALGDINRRILTQELIASGELGGLMGGIGSVARQVIDDKDISIPQTVVDVGLGAGLGVAGDAGVRGIAKGVGALAKGLKPKFKNVVQAADGSSVKPQLMDDAIDYAKKASEALTVGKELTPPQKSEIVTYYFHEYLSDHGVNVSIHAGALGDRFSRSLLNKTTLASTDDRSLGTRLTDVTINLINASNKSLNDKQGLKAQAGVLIKQLDDLGYSRQDQVKMLMHTESLPDGTAAFNPAGEQITQSFFRQAYDGPAVSLEAQQALNGLRKWYDEGWAVNSQYAPDLGRIKGYVPIKQRVESKQPPIKRTIQDLDRVGNPGLAEHREVSTFDPLKHIDDLGVLVDSYASQTAFHSNFAPIIKDLQREITKLNLIGDKKKAEFWGKHFARVLGMGGEKDIVKFVGNDIIEGNRNIIQEFLTDQTDDPSKVDSAFRVLKQLATNNLLFSSPRIYVQQLTQPTFMGTAEIGRYWVQQGARKARDSKSAVSKLADEMMDFMTVKDPNFVLESESLEVANRFINGTLKVSEGLAKPVKYFNNKRDLYNRKMSFIGAYEQFKNSANPADILDGLTHGEQQFIKRTLEKEGAEAAARAYGITRSRRINFAYGLADAPEFFASDLGRYIPFSTWSRSTLSRFAEDVAEGNFEQLTRRILDPMMLAAQFSLMSGMDIQGVNPVSAAASTLTTNLLPVGNIVRGQGVLSGLAETFVPGGKLVGTGIDLTTGSKKQREKALLRQFATEKQHKTSPLYHLRKAIRKEFDVK